MHGVMHGAQDWIFDRHAVAYDRLSRPLAGRLHRRVVADAVAATPEGGVVLDVGCGPGRVAIALAARRPDLTVHAVDLSPDMIALARRRADAAGVAGRIRVARGDVADLDLPDRYVDLVVSTLSFHHWADVPGAARELARVVRPGGRIWIYDVRFAPWRSLAAAGAAVHRRRAGLLTIRGEVRTG